MFGFVIGTVCLLGLFKLGAHARSGRHGGCSRGGGRDFRGRHGGWRGEEGRQGRGWGGPRMSMEGRAKRMLIRRLGLREEQEVTLDASIADAKKAFERYADDMKASRSGLASAVRGDSVDHIRLGVLFESHDESTATLRADMVRAIERLHAALDADQRIRLSDLLSTDLFGWYQGEE